VVSGSGFAVRLFPVRWMVGWRDGSVESRVVVVMRSSGDFSLP
jgi:hypothetical protein